MWRHVANIIKIHYAACTGTSAPRLATAERAAVWQERRLPPSPSAPLKLTPWDDAEEALQQPSAAADGEPRAAAEAAGEATRDAAAPLTAPGAIMEVCSDLPAVAATGGGGSGSTNGTATSSFQQPHYPVERPPERQPSGTWPRGILKTSDSLKSAKLFPTVSA